MWKLTEIVAKHSKAKRTTKAVLLALAHRADRDGYCYPSIRCIARDAGVDKRTVQRCLRRLIMIGELAIHEHGGRDQTNGGRQWTNQYQILLQVPGEGVTTTAKGGGKNAKRGVANVSQGGGVVPPESKRKRELKLLVKESLPDELDYGDFYDPSLDPMALANHITSEYDPRAKGYRKKMLGIIGDEQFRRTLADAWGVIKGDRPDRPGAILTNMLKDRANGSREREVAS